VQTSLKTVVDAAAKMPSLLPDGPKTGGETKAMPAIFKNCGGCHETYRAGEN
jgi:cytochrome c556